MRTTKRTEFGYGSLGSETISSLCRSTDPRDTPNCPEKKHPVVFNRKPSYEPLGSWFDQRHSPEKQDASGSEQALWFEGGWERRRFSHHQVVVLLTCGAEAHGPVLHHWTMKCWCLLTVGLVRHRSIASLKTVARRGILIPLLSPSRPCLAAQLDKKPKSKSVSFPRPHTTVS